MVSRATNSLDMTCLIKFQFRYYQQRTTLNEIVDPHSTSSWGYLTKIHFKPCTRPSDSETPFKYDQVFLAILRSPSRRIPTDAAISPALVPSTESGNKETHLWRYSPEVPLKTSSLSQTCSSNPPVGVIVPKNDKPCVDPQHRWHVAFNQEPPFYRKAFTDPT